MSADVSTRGGADPGPTHMSADEFRAAAHEVVEWIIRYHEHTVHEAPVLPNVKPGDIARALPAHAPEHPRPWRETLEQFERTILPGVTHWQAPGFHAFFPSAYSHPSMLGDMLCGALGAVGFLWQGCPAMTEVETVVLDWLGEMIGLPLAFLDGASNHSGGGVIQGTASEAVLVAMLAARARGTSALRADSSPDQPPRPNPAPILTAYTSTQAHSSIVKAAMVSGIGRENVRLIGVDDRLALRPDLLEQAIEKDRAEGRVPFFICATVGTTSTTAVDPVPAIGAIAQRHGVWLHVDAAYAGAAMVCPEFRWMNAGIELADSYNFNPHKWLLTGFDCSALWVRDRRPLIDALSITPEYLRNKASETGAVIDYRDWQVPLGRRFRALKLWFVLRHYGVSGLQAFIREHVGLAERFEQMVREDEARRFEVVTPRVLGLVCIRPRYVGSPSRHDLDTLTRRIHERINATGQAYLTHTVIPLPDGSGDGYVIRVSIGTASTKLEHVERLWRLLCEAADAES
ncbi:MAG: pyridoxal-dependent decarboxylase [Phycisphaerales bacterium]